MLKFGGKREESTRVATSDTESKGHFVVVKYRERWTYSNADRKVSVERERFKIEGCGRVDSRDQQRDSTDKGTSSSEAGGRRGQMIDVITVRCAGRRAGIRGSSCLTASNTAVNEEACPMSLKDNKQAH